MTPLQDQGGITGKGYADGARHSAKTNAPSVAKLASHVPPGIRPEDLFGAKQETIPKEDNPITQHP